MIITNIASKDLESFKNIHPRFNAAFEFIKKAVNENLSEGDYEIDGKNIYAFISSYKTKKRIMHIQTVFIADCIA